MEATFKMSRNIDDISSIFRVSVHPNTISANDSWLRAKSDNIADISVRQQYIDDIVDEKSARGMMHVSLLKFV